MSVQTPRPVRGPPRRHPSIEFRASPLRSASRASPTTPAPNHSTNPTAVLGHWRPPLTHQDRRDSSELRKKIKVILGESLDEDSTPRPVQIEAIAALSNSINLGTGIDMTLSMYLIYGRWAVTIVAANLNRKGKNAIVVSEETWRDGELYRQLDDPNHKISFILIVCAG
ncbi:BZ3500_MvSof-1268-A1-R1_Chr9g10738 [Microbotryum saponariae]|uniref:BZ3500_MvSof-1268-A1-R1_Chr9g10738 protein n=1 Tax=Microbotryum saponariae TaxID=289078 RepID=A0A2X0KV88_9BASI|nr:BZ3501_MvSof-1269-A2-R1_Chr9g10486 [Microbotryum saponariae]SDA00609.1 BZ3500_MvSof-1268-A1-R1_Chr9g10738 [Microbotryum saponariae]